MIGFFDYFFVSSRYFTPGDLGFKAFRAPSLIPRGESGTESTSTSKPASPIIGQLICNDRRWAEGWRVYGLQGTEIMCCGYVSGIGLFLSFFFFPS